MYIPGSSKVMLSIEEKMDTINTYSQDALEYLKQHKTAVTVVLTSACGLLLLRNYLQGGKCRSKARMDGKTVLITGANTGIGKETAKDLAKRGARVLLACRSKERADAAADEIRQYSGSNNVAVYILDLSSLTSVRECAAEVIAKETRLDVLINNAGGMWVPSSKTKDGIEIHFATNHLGPFLLTNLLLELVKKSTPSRIVNVVSDGHRYVPALKFDDLNNEKGSAVFETYFHSKLANMLFNRELSKRLKGTSVTANTVHPGVVKTELGRFIENLSLPYRILMTLSCNLMKPFMKTASRGAQTSIYVAVSPELENITGKYFSECALAKPSDYAEDDAAAARLWQVSEEMVGLRKK